MSQQLDLKPGDRILISRTDRLGDLILALPFVESIKARYPECDVHVMASLYASPILENNPNIDGIVRVQNDQLKSSKNYRRELARKIRKPGFRTVVFLYPERHISRLVYQLGIEERLGTAGRFHSVYYSHRLMHSRKANLKHESVYNLDFLKYFRAGETVERPKVFPTDKEQSHAARVLRNAGVEGPFVVLHPGSGGSAERWPMPGFVSLYEKLKKQGRNVVITGSLEEGSIIRQLASKADVKIQEIAGQTDLRTLAAILSQATMVVANSTGPLHLAVAVGTPVVGLYPGKKIMSPVRWGPLGDGNRVIQPDTDHCRCPEGQCRCMDTIEVDDVIEVVDEVYANAVG